MGYHGSSWANMCVSIYILYGGPLAHRRSTRMKEPRRTQPKKKKIDGDLREKKDLKACLGGFCSGSNPRWIPHRLDLYNDRGGDHKI